MRKTRQASHLRKRHLPLLISAALAGPSSLAHAQSEGDSPILSNVVVSANRSETQIDAVPATITTTDRQSIDRRMPHDETSLFADEPDLAVARDLRRFGASSINIRGIEGNRVLQQVDGVRLPDFYSGGGPSNATTSSADGPEMDFLKRVEVLRGPASSLYGSDALGGVVSYFTLDLGGAVRELNQTGAALLGAERKVLLGQLLSVFLAPDSARELRALLMSAGDGLRGKVCELQLSGHRAGSRKVYATVSADPVGGAFLVALMDAGDGAPVKQGGPGAAQ